MTPQQVRSLETKALNGDNEAAVSLSYIMSLREGDRVGIAWMRLAAARGDCSAISTMFMLAQPPAISLRGNADNSEMRMWRKKARAAGCEWKGGDVVNGERAEVPSASR